eukprot:TRINITY_DN14624_c0_g1_i2.p2 TRINITY_DN14624_c0_g1~~TRINITY_DN14624_c0_g1_i2.p2  ORF type:complete len:208 (-),score=20.98 TRINITY_DN14624_c0_g1_i2:823-1446(-)
MRESLGRIVKFENKVAGTMHKKSLSTAALIGTGKDGGGLSIRENSRFAMPHLVEFVLGRESPVAPDHHHPQINSVARTLNNNANIAENINKDLLVIDNVTQDPLLTIEEDSCRCEMSERDNYNLHLVRHANQGYDNVTVSKKRNASTPQSAFGMAYFAKMSAKIDESPAEGINKDNNLDRSVPKILFTDEDRVPIQVEVVMRDSEVI